MDSPHVSLNMIVRDSSATLRRAILSVKDFVDEIIVVDTGSKDNTVEIAKELGAEVHFFKWIDDYAAARNFALEKSHGDWILWLDDDEWIDEENLKKLLKQNFSKDRYYVITRLMEKPEKFHALKTNSPRIFPNRPDVRWRSRVHETIHESAKEAGLEKELLDVTIINDGYETNRDKKSLYYKNLLAEELKNKPHDAYLLYHYAQECRVLKLYEEAAHYYGESILYFPDEEIAFLREALPNYIHCLISSNQVEKAIEVLLLSRDIFPDSPRLLDLYATVQRFMGSSEKAEEVWKELLQFTYDERMNDEMLHPIGTRLAALDRLGKLYFEQGRINEARECWNQALTIDPGFEGAVEGLKKINLQ